MSGYDPEPPALVLKHQETGQRVGHEQRCVGNDGGDFEGADRDLLVLRAADDRQIVPDLERRNEHDQIGYEQERRRPQQRHGDDRAR